MPFPPALCPCVCVCVCLRLANCHAGLAVGGCGPHPDLLSGGADLPVLQLQESLLQGSVYHAVLCRYVIYSEEGRAEGH